MLVNEALEALKAKFKDKIWQRELCALAVKFKIGSAMT